MTPTTEAKDTGRDVAPPSRDEPELGSVVLHGVVISNVLYWVEDGDHVFRSTEFDVIAGDADRDAAIRKFVDSADDLAGSIVELSHQDEATHAEIETAITLLQRFAEAYRAATRERQRLVNLHALRRRAHASGYRRSTPRNSSQLQPV